MKKVYLFVILIATTLFWQACDKEVELLAEYEDITVVYGLISPEDSLSYLRIEKAFLTDGDVFEAAQVADSNSYPYKLDVRMYSNNREITFDTMTVRDKEDGIFYNPEMMVYYAVTNNMLNDEDEYHLEVTNPKTGKVVTSSSYLIDASGIRLDYPKIKISFTSDKAVEFNSINNGRLYQLNLRFHYTERNIVSDERSDYFVDWIFPSVQTDYLDGGDIIYFPYIGEQFYLNLLSNIPYKENIERYEGQVELIVSVADDTFNTYMEVNEPSTSLVIERPSYTNIENGYGVFASRSNYIGFYSLSQPSIAELRTYDQLNFEQRPDE